MCLAIPGKVEAIDERSPLERSARVRFGGIAKTVNLAFVPEAKVGDYVLVHVGVALSTIDEAEADQVFRYLEEMGQVEEELGPPGAET
ncbi:MAG: HypC/HybG/HupF family hydrogenase formation chaperone [Fimbriimonadaceae bacterium]|nr:HypC/HybG/HupF family hydrogenase formation chaperone [Fimbriimonadaceae bacterium]